jgi:eukaryotic-like serine/threonine-protein kinase
MTRDDWTAVKTITAGALALPPSERDVYVTSRCGSDAFLRVEVQSLLESIAASANLYENPVFPATPLLTSLSENGEPVDPVIGGRIGPYRVVSEIGQGGMGTAYLAVRDDETFEKRVAIKLIKRGMDTDAILRRFRHERQILASLEHPNIVTLLDGGTTASGLPYFVMEYVDGVPIDAYSDAKALTIRDRLKLFLAVCGAVQHAHQQRVIHRDLKPSNILVTKSGVLKLLDFGIAKLLDPERDGQTLDAVLLAGVMTPQYSSPEQIRGDPATAASDVYSLGMLLYVLLAGRVPYRMSDVRTGEPPRIHHLPPPSGLVDEAASRRRAERQAQLRRRLSGDLDVIALTALHTEPERRYRSVQALADDVQRYMDGHPIAAQRDRMAGRLVAFARRQRGRAYAAAVAGATVVAAAALLPRPDTPSSNPLVEVRSIAVLPLACAAADDVEYLCDGIAEDVSRRLSRVPHLRVISRDSSYQHKDSGTDALQVGRDLGADAVLLGTAVRRGAQLAIAAELVDARDRRRLWGNRFERPISDVHDVPRELADQVVAAVRPQFTAAERRATATRYTPNEAGYEAYLRGRYFWNKRTPEGLTRSLEYFRAAVAADRSFALAHAGVADALAMLTEYHTLPAADTYREAKAAVSRALELDDTLAEAHTSHAYLLQFYEWKWPEAEAAFRRAIALNPNYATAHQWYAEFLSASGRHDEALSEIRTAIALDPVSLIVNAVEANLLYMAGRYDEAIAKGQHVVDMDPNFPEVYEFLKRSYDQKGLFREAIAARQTRRRLLGRDLTETPALAAAAAATDPREYWRNRVTQELVEARTEGLAPFELAELLAQAGDPTRALDWLERACAELDFMVVYTRVAPNLEPLRREPRYLNLLRRGCPVQPIPVTSRTS